MNPAIPIALLAVLAVVCLLLSARYQRKEKARQEREFEIEFEETWNWPQKKDELP